MCVFKGKGKIFYNGRGKHQLVQMQELCSTASWRYDKANSGAGDSQMAMKAAGRKGNVSETFQLSVDKALKAEGANY